MNISHNNNMYKQEFLFILHFFIIKSRAHCTQQLCIAIDDVMIQVSGHIHVHVIFRYTVDS